MLFRSTIPGLLSSALAMQRDDGLTPAQAIMSANAPMIIQKAMVEGRPADGVLPSGQVAGVISELISCQQLIQEIVQEAEQRFAALADIQTGAGAASAATRTTAE